MNTLEGSILHITHPGDYTCDIVRVNYETISQTRLYLLHEKSTGNNYWSMPLQASVHYSTLLKILGQIVLEDGINKLRILNRNQIMSKGTIEEQYIIYTPSVKLYRIPSLYTIVNHKRKWNEYCEHIIKNKLNVPIRIIINILELKQLISEFL